MCPAKTRHLTLETLLEQNASRFWACVDKSGPNDCWRWTKATNRLGYGVFCMGAKWRSAHRVSFMLSVGSIPTSLEIDHICRVRYCVNPSHLRLCTRAENMRNQGLNPRNTSGFKGVSWHKAQKKWAAYIQVNGKPKTLGYFKTPEEASQAREKAEVDIYGGTLDIKVPA